MQLPASEIQTAHVYIWRKGETTRFKVGKTTQDVAKRTKGSLRNNEPDYADFDCIELDTKCHSACETYLKNHLESKRVPGTAEIFVLSSVDEMTALIASCRAYFAEWIPLQQTIALVAKQQSKRFLVAGPDELKAFAEYAAARERKDACLWQFELLENRLKSIIGTAAGIKGLVSWKTDKQGDDRFDLNAFKDAEPEGYNELLARYPKYKYTPMPNRSLRPIYVGDRSVSEET